MLIKFEFQISKANFLIFRLYPMQFGGYNKKYLLLILNSYLPEHVEFYLATLYQVDQTHMFLT